MFAHTPRAARIGVLLARESLLILIIGLLLAGEAEAKEREARIEACSVHGVEEDGGGRALVAVINTCMGRRQQGMCCVVADRVGNSWRRRSSKDVGGMMGGDVFV